MSNRDMCVSVIDSMEEWQLRSVLEMLQAVKETMDKLEAGVLETKELLFISEMGEKLMEGMKTPLSECVPKKRGWFMKCLNRNRQSRSFPYGRIMCDKWIR